jgi:hypothetical protein
MPKCQTKMYRRDDDRMHMRRRKQHHNRRRIKQDPLLLRAWA